MSNENQEQSEIQPVENTTADGTLDATPSVESAAPASDLSPTTPPPTESEALPRTKVADVDDYQKRLAAALAPAPATTEPVAGEIPPPVASSENTEPVPPITPVEGTTPPVESKKEFRPRLSGLDTRMQEAILLVKELKDQGQDITLAECERRIGLKYGEPAEADAPEVVPVAAEPTSESIDARITELELELEVAAANIDTEAMGRISKEIRLQDRALLKAQSKEERANSQAETDFTRGVEASRARTAEVYPAAVDPESPISAEAARIWKDLEAQNNPLIFDQNAPFKVFQMAGNNLGIAPGSAAPVKQSPPSATPKPQAVIQSAVRSRPNPAPVASGSERTTNGPAATTVDLGKSRSPHEYNQRLRSLGLSGV